MKLWAADTGCSVDSTGIVGFSLEGEDDNRRYSAVFFILLPNAEVKDGIGENMLFFHWRGNQKQGLNKVVTIAYVSDSAPSHRQP